MTDYEHTLTVAIKALSELIEDNRKLRATIETLSESKDCPKSNQSKTVYSIQLDPLERLIAYSISQNMVASDIAKYLADHSNTFIYSKTEVR